MTAAVALVLAAAAGGEAVVVFGGDVMLDRLPGEAITHGTDPMAALAPVLAGADLAVANLECPVAAGGAPVEKPYAFRAHPRTAALLARHFGAVSLANNHSGDHGPGALVETMDLLRGAGVHFFGAGRDLAGAHAPLVVERRGVRIALLGYDEFMPRRFEATSTAPGVAWSEDEQAVSDVRRARTVHRAEVVIPFLHWGWEGETTPGPRQRDLARRLVGAGADAVVGTHPHTTQGAEIVAGRPVVYSLGNLVFDGFDDPSTTRGWLLRLVVDRRGVARMETVGVNLDAQGAPSPVPDAAAPCWRRGDKSVRACVGAAGTR